MRNPDPLLPPAEFQEKKNNFHLHFAAGESGELHRTKEHYLRTEAEMPGFKRLAATLEAQSSRGVALNPQLLYIAYEMMHPHAQSNRGLFQ